MEENSVRKLVPGCGDVIASTAQRCELDLPPDEPVGTSPSITLRPATPVTMRVSPR